ncbi:26S proteasome subunit RPN7-domain-containing protein [Pelagophyceae sp. CCMP2097]|nr:26S proteasome subunit RPN7-domain-containing protein [Pelagophyceae sp. CCMP2097]|mmetsp:Transcript_4777/g.17051  ORF Transcript_4777/g.17051 Transcript_4777/m.17051 type:complete len:518 (+) Transcript_4777:62-1615(+)
MASGAAVDCSALARRAAGLPPRALVRRLLFVAKNSEEPQQKQEAAAMAVEHARRGSDSALYLEACAACADAGDARGGAVDGSWVEAADSAWQLERDRLEAALHAARSGSGKDVLQRAHKLLGEAAYARGEGQLALKSFVRMRDYSTTPRQTLDMCVRVCVVAADVGSWSHVTSYAAKADHALESTHDVVTGMRLRCAVALALLNERDYAAAAPKLVDVVLAAAAPVPEGAPRPRDEGWDVCAAGDAAGLAALAALATFDRKRLASDCVNSVTFRNAVAVAAPKALELVQAFFAGRYANALHLLAAVGAELRLDPNAAPHVDALTKLVQDRMVAQYCAPYQTLCLLRLAATFELPLVEAEANVARLVDAGLIVAKIDSKANALRRVDGDHRRADFAKLVDQGDAYVREMRALAMRISCLEHDVVVRGRNPTSAGPPVAGHSREHLPAGPWQARRRDGAGPGGGFSRRSFERSAFPASAAMAADADDDDDMDVVVDDAHAERARDGDAEMHEAPRAPAV